MATVSITLGHCILHMRGVTEYVCVHAELHSRVAQLCLTLCDTMDCSPSDSPVHRIVQAGILEWVAISYSVADRFFTSVPPWSPSNICVCVCMCILTYFVNLKAGSIIIL